MKPLTYKLINGNSAEELKQFPDNHFDSVVTDPPYGINFLGKDWDKDTGEEEVYRQCFRVLKPGGHLLAFSAARTYHHLAMAVERSGFEIRDQIMWVYGSGFPKSQDVGRQIERAAGKRAAVGNGYSAESHGGGQITPRTNNDGGGAMGSCPKCGKNNAMFPKNYNACQQEPCVVREMYKPAQNEWAGWGTNLKPAHEPIVMAQKPFKDAIYKNVQKWGTGAINVDGCRVPLGEGDPTPEEWKKGWDRTAGGAGEYSKIAGEVEHGTAAGGKNISDYAKDGRFPANFIHDGSPDVVALFPDNSQRFFYSAKVSKSERNIGQEQDSTNNHPTVKPVALMKYLVTLITPPGGKVLDPFNGSGSTGMACAELDMDYTGIELDTNYIAISEKRIEAWYNKTHPQPQNPFGNDLFSEQDTEE